MLKCKNRVFNPYFFNCYLSNEKTAFVDNSRVKATIFFIEKISFSLKLFSCHFYGQSFIKTVRGPYWAASRSSIPFHPTSCISNLYLYYLHDIFLFSNTISSFLKSSLLYCYHLMFEILNAMHVLQYIYVLGDELNKL